MGEQQQRDSGQGVQVACNSVAVVVAVDWTRWGKPGPAIEAMKMQLRPADGNRGRGQAA